MAGFITLEDGRAWTASNRGYDDVVDALVSALQGEGANEFATWLAQQTCLVRGTGLGYIDLRELAPENRRLFRLAVRSAILKTGATARDASCDAEWHASWVERFQLLPLLLESVDRGDDPRTFNPLMNDLLPWDGEKRGPGW